MNKPLGRLKERDEASRNFPIRALIAQEKPRSYHWECKPSLNQGREGACVGFAFSHEAAAEPVVVKKVTNKVARAIYKRAQQLDNYPGEDYEGTSVLGGAKACVEKGWFGSYRWAFGLEDLLLALSYAGPVVLGVNWYEGMDKPSNGIIRVTGDLRGGHAILANGIDVEKKLIRLHNSWGRNWGRRGECFISFKDLDRLLHEEGEACVPLTRKL